MNSSCRSDHNKCHYCVFVFDIIKANVQRYSSEYSLSLFLY